MPPTKMIADPECRRCELGGTARHTCIPTTQYSSVWPRSRKHALLIVAQSPGTMEDDQGRNLVGPSGSVLANVYLGSEVPALADIFLANTVRCYVQAQTKIAPKWVKACGIYLQSDIVALVDAYDAVTILCLGAVAAKAISGHSLTQAFAAQGSVGLCPNVPVFATYHPAAIMYNEGADPKSCKPQLIGAVGSHITLLVHHLEGKNVRSAWTIETPTPYLRPPEIER